MNIEAIRTLISDDLQATDQLIIDRLHSDVALVNQLGYYIVNSGGKRLRPMLVLLSALANGYQGQHHRTLAAVVEFIHTATLLHDDVVDASDMRRGRDTANALFGNEASVLVGDYLYSRAFQMMVEVGVMKVMEILADTTNVIAEGEVLQLMNCNDPDTTESRYFEVITNKTAKLFAAATQLGAVLAGQTESREQALTEYGLHLGIAFQLVDDALDYSSSSDEMGKNAGDDLAEGKPTLPLLHAMEHGNPEQRSLIRAAIEQGGLEHLEEIQQAIADTKALDYTLHRAQEHVRLANQALQSLPDTPYKQALTAIAELSLARTH